jgi:hypothetical protein
MSTNLQVSGLYETTLINLRILRSIEPGHRLDTTQRFFRVHQKRSQLVPVFFSRWWNQQDRNSDICRIQSLYHQAVQCCHTCDPTSKKRMLDYIKKSESGLKNLQTTYRIDLTMVALIDVILDQIERQRENTDELPNE